MGATNTTPNFGLPQFVDGDKPTWRGDINGAFNDIDDALFIKADATSVYTKAESDAALAGKVAKGSLLINVKDFGAVGDGVADDTTAINDAITNAAVGAQVYFPPGNYKITTDIEISKKVWISGASKFNTMVTAFNCNAFTILNGVNHVSISNLGIFQNVSYSTVVNTFIGVDIQGTDASHSGYHRFEQLYIQGFETSFKCVNVWETRFESVYTVQSKFGITSYGLSENNVVHACEFIAGNGTSAQVAGSVNINLLGQVSDIDAGPKVSEGWIITNNVLFNADIAVNGFGYASYIIANNIIDFIHKAAVWVESNGTAVAGMVLIDGNYMAVAPNAVITNGVIEFNNSVAGQRASRIVNNDILCYTNVSCAYGIRLNLASNSGNDAMTVMGNVISGMNTSDIQVESGSNIIVGNRCGSNLVAPKYNIWCSESKINLVSNNAGRSTVNISTGVFPNTYSMNGPFKVALGVQAPAALPWNVGDRVINSQPAVGAPKSWVCTVAGTPGTWVSEGNL
jgi:hypothetical protein